MEKTAKQFSPFQKVLVRDFPISEWVPAFYCRKEHALNRHQVMGHHNDYSDSDIIAYEGNEYLAGTNLDPE